MIERMLKKDGKYFYLFIRVSEQKQVKNNKANYKKLDHFNKLAF